MFDYVFIRIIKAETRTELDAIKYALTKTDSLSDVQKAELDLLASICKESIILREVVEINEKNMKLHNAFMNSCAEIVESALEAIGETTPNP